MHSNWQYTVEYPQDAILLNVANTEQALDSAVDFLKGKAEELRKPVLTPRQEAILAYADEKGYNPISIEGDMYYDIRSKDSSWDASGKKGDRYLTEGTEYKILHEWTESYMHKGKFYTIYLFAYKDVYEGHGSINTYISPSYS